MTAKQRGMKPEGAAQIGIVGGCGQLMRAGGRNGRPFWLVYGSSWINYWEGGLLSQPFDAAIEDHGPSAAGGSINDTSSEAVDLIIITDGVPVLVV